MRDVRLHFAFAISTIITGQSNGFAADSPEAAQLASVNTAKADPEEALKATVAGEIRKFYDRAKARDLRLVDSGKTKEDRQRRFADDFEDRLQLSRRLNDLAMSAPKTHAARNATFWILSNSYEEGHPAIELGRAFRFLVQFHADDPLVINYALDHSGYSDFDRDLLFNGLYAGAKSRESKGLARFALALYLKVKAENSAIAQSDPDQRFVIRGTGKGNEKIVTDQPIPEMRFAYRQNLRFEDTGAMARRSRELFDEVIRDYTDVPYSTGKMREMEAALAAEPPEYHGKRLSTDDQRDIGLFLNKEKSTLGEQARRILDGSDYLPIGQPAPEIDAETVDGNRLRLSDHKGKVVVLIFWGTWCGPCMAEIPYEKAMAKKFAGKPVAILGINSDVDREKAAAAIAKEGITWPNLYDGNPVTGEIVADYRVTGFPTTVVIDHKGNVRYLNEMRDVLENLVDGLLAEMESSKPQP
jgi:thiol-disulfide isomerase/thioredoxin